MLGGMEPFPICVRKEGSEMAKESGRYFRDKSRGKPQRKRKPVVLLIAEGQNKTEKLYFWHFSTPESKYAVKVVSRGETGPQGCWRP